MKKNVFKIILDAVMLALLLLMYDARAISSAFHEIGGIALFGLLILHNALNFKWIAYSGRRLFSKTLPGRVRLKFIIDVLLFVSIALITVSGILISEVVFRAARGGGAWKTVHYFASAVTLILLGVHIGLNWAFVKHMIKLPRVAAIPLVVVLLAAILGFGCYSLVTSNFAGWLASPFTAGAFEGGHGPGEGNFALPEGVQGQFTPPADGQTNADQLPPGNGEAPRAQFGGNGKGFGQGSGQGFRGHGTEGSGGALGTLAAYGSITGVFAVITAVTDKLIRKAKKRKTSAAEASGGGEEPERAV